MILRAALRSCWYSLSEIVCDGATTIESPVCTPIGSMFSMLQTVMQVSAPSRMTSHSSSFQPLRLRSTRICPIGDALMPRCARSRSSAGSAANPPPVPPSVYAGRMTTGKPIRSVKRSASSTVWAVTDSGTGSPILMSSCLNASRSSAVLIASSGVPRNFTP